MEEVNPRLGAKNAGIGTTVCVICYLILSFIIAQIVGASGLSNKSDGYKYISYLVSPLCLAVGMAITLAVTRQKASSALKLKCNAKYFLIALLVMYGVFGLLSEVNDIVTQKLFEPLGYTPRNPNDYLPNLSGWKILPAILVIALLPAVFEELFFRGMLLSRLRSSAGDIPSVFIVGFIFALYHGSPEQTVYQFICGCLFAFIAVRAGSVLPCMTVHFLNNATILVLAACGFSDATGGMAMPWGAQIALMVTGGIALAGGVVWLIFDKKQLIKPTKGGAAVYFIYAAAGIAALAVVWVAGFFV